jgi:hypothetical protein
MRGRATVGEVEQVLRADNVGGAGTPAAVPLPGRIRPGSLSARPLRADDSPGRVPPGETMPVKDRAAQAVTED